MPPRTGNKRAELRACLVCSILRTSAQFMDEGCPNCEDVVEMQNNLEQVRACTSVRWDGMIAMIRPTESWVARWQRIEKKEAGYYAVRVIGKAPEVVIANIESKGGVYRSRDEIED